MIRFTKYFSMLSNNRFKNGLAGIEKVLTPKPDILSRSQHLHDGRREPTSTAVL